MAISSYPNGTLLWERAEGNMEETAKWWAAGKKQTMSV